MTQRRLKARLRQLTDLHRSIAMPVRLALLNRFLGGWAAYFALAETPSVFDEVDEWLRRRLRQVRWKEWKGFAARRRNLHALGTPERQAALWAASRKGYWRMAGSAPLSRAMPNRYWASLGLVPLGSRVRRLREHRRTAGCGSACPVVWEGAVRRRPQPDSSRPFWWSARPSSASSWRPGYTEIRRLSGTSRLPAYGAGEDVGVGDVGGGVIWIGVGFGVG